MRWSDTTEKESRFVLEENISQTAAAGGKIIFTMSPRNIHIYLKLELVRAISPYTSTYVSEVEQKNTVRGGNGARILAELTWLTNVSIVELAFYKRQKHLFLGKQLPHLEKSYIVYIQYCNAGCFLNWRRLKVASETKLQVE